MSFEDPPRQSPLLFKPSDVDPELICSEPWFSWFFEVKKRLNPGITAVVPLAPITALGTLGSLTFKNGILIAVTQPT